MLTPAAPIAARSARTGSPRCSGPSPASVCTRVLADCASPPTITTHTSRPRSSIRVTERPEGAARHRQPLRRRRPLPPPLLTPSHRVPPRPRRMGSRAPRAPPHPGSQVPPAPAPPAPALPAEQVRQARPRAVTPNRRPVRPAPAPRSDQGSSANAEAPSARGRAASVKANGRWPELPPTGKRQASAIAHRPPAPSPEASSLPGTWTARSFRAR